MFMNNSNVYECQRLKGEITLLEENIAKQMAESVINKHFMQRCTHTHTQTLNQKTADGNVLRN